MKDWKDCKKVKEKIKILKIENKPYKMKHYSFDACHSCNVEKCKGKVLINAKGKALNAVNKYMK